MTDKTVCSCNDNPPHGLPVLALIKLPFLLTLLLLSVCGCSSSAVKYADGVKTGPVVILGDSLAEGYLVEPEECFVSILNARLGIEIVNLGKKGATTTESLPRVTAEVLPLKPALVIIELGGNDALQRIDPEMTRKNLQSMIDLVHKEKIPVLLLGVRGGLMSDKLADIFEDLVDANGLAYVSNILEGILTSPGLRVDNVHPNLQGHTLIADRVEPELRALTKALGIKTK